MKGDVEREKGREARIGIKERKERRGKGRGEEERKERKGKRARREGERVGSWGRGSERPLGSRWLCRQSPFSLFRKKSGWYSVMHTNSSFLPTSCHSRGGKKMEA